MDNQKSKKLTQFSVAVSLIILLIIIGTVIFHLLEKWTWIQSFYFTICTLATVGYGDLHPTSDGARLFTAIFILIGVSVAIAAFSIIGSRYINRRVNQIIKDKNNNNQ